MADTKALKRRFDEVRSARANVESVWDEIETYIMPLAGPKKTIATEGGVVWKRPEVWDMTAIDGAQKLANNIHASAIPNGLIWAKFAFLHPELAEDQEAQEYLDEVADALFLTLQESDFDTEMQSGLQEFTGPGNMFIIEEPVDRYDWKGLDFTACPLREAFFEPDSRGGVKAFYRLLQWTAVQIQDRFPDADLPERIKQKLETGSGITDRFDVVFAIYERPEIVAKMERERKARVEARKAGKREESPVPLAPEMRPFGGCYFLADGAEQLGEEVGYYEMPVFHSAWERTPDSIWGHGPGNIALPTVKQLNRWAEIEFKAAAKVVDPVTMVTELGLLSDLDLKPGGLVLVKDMESMRPYESGARFDVTSAKTAEMRAQIRQLFFVDELHLKDSPQMTATEAQIRYELMNRLFGPTLGRFQSNLLSPLLRCALGHLARAGKLPPKPEKVKRLDPDFEIRYLGPLARSRRTDEVANIERATSLALGMIKGGFTEVRHAFKPVEAFKEAVQLLGCPASLVASDVDIEKGIKEEQAAVKRQMDAEAAKTESEAAANMAKSGAGQVPPPTTPYPAAPPPLLAPTLEV